MKVPVKLPGGGTGYAYRWVKQGQAPGAVPKKQGDKPPEDPVADAAEELVEALMKEGHPFSTAVKIANKVQGGKGLTEAAQEAGLSNPSFHAAVYNSAMELGGLLAEAAKARRSNPSVSGDTATAKANSEKMIGLFRSKDSQEHKDYSARQIGNRLMVLRARDLEFGKALTTLYNALYEDAKTFGRYESMTEEVVDAILGSWASSSYDHSALAIAFQEAVEDEFQLRDAAQRGRKSVDLHVYEPHRQTLRRVARAMYEVTQEFLKEQGITELWLARGVYADDEDEASRLFEGVPEEAWGNSQSYDVESVNQPLTSWASNLETAVDFSRGGYVQMVMVARVPAERVFATALVGIGCTGERESVPLGGKMQVRARFRSSGADGDSWGLLSQKWEDYLQEPAVKKALGAEITVRPDANDKNADWLINRAKKAKGKPPKKRPGLRWRPKKG